MRHCKWWKLQFHNLRIHYLWEFGKPDGKIIYCVNCDYQREFKDPTIKPEKLWPRK